MQFWRPGVVETLRILSSSQCARSITYAWFGDVDGVVLFGVDWHRLCRECAYVSPRLKFLAILLGVCTVERWRKFKLVPY